VRHADLFDAVGDITGSLPLRSIPVTDTRTDVPDTAIQQRPWLALVALLLGVSLIVLEGSIVNVLIPTIVEDLSIGRTDVLWITSIYSLVFASLLITFGVLADRFGRRRMFMLGTVIFIAFNLMAGAAGSAEVLIIARAGEAVGGAMMLPTSMAIINVNFRGPMRAAAFGLWGAVFGGMAAFGPLLGGWLADIASWRWAFYINIPLGIISLIMVRAFVSESKGTTRRALDYTGVIASSLGLGLVVFGLIEGQQLGWWTAITQWDMGPISIAPGALSPVPIAIALGMAMLAIFIVLQATRRKAGKSYLIDLSLFRIRRYGFGNIVATLVSLGEFGVLFAMPLWLQSVHGFSALQTGALLAILGVGVVMAGGAARHFSAIIGSTRLIRVGMVLEIIGIGGVAVMLSSTSSPWWLAIPFVIYGIGLGFDTAQLTNVILEDVPAERSGGASSVTSTLRQVGSTLGAAVLGTVLFVSLGMGLSNQLATNQPQLSEADRTALVDQIVDSSGEAIIPLSQQPGSEQIVQEAKDAYTTAVRIMAVVAGGAMVVGLIASFGLPADAPREQRGGGSFDQSKRSRGAAGARRGTPSPSE
jgi:EmrB/QacA subfamily drug resistance transporter